MTVKLNVWRREGLCRILEINQENDLTASRARSFEHYSAASEADSGRVNNNSNCETLDGPESSRGLISRSHAPHKQKFINLNKCRLAQIGQSEQFQAVSA
jgi:hypothetical protein